LTTFTTLFSGKTSHDNETWSVQPERSIISMNQEPEQVEEPVAGHFSVQKLCYRKCGLNTSQIVV
jgi:hypothetical protein